MTKITLIGGGSFSWGPIFLRDIFTAPELQGSEVVLEDIIPENLERVHALGEKMLHDLNLEFYLERTLNLEEALNNADFVILTITTGGLEAMRTDLEIPAKYGIRQAVGDTIGPGGLSRALRNIPVVVEIARKVDEICPDAFFLNYTNPLTVLTRSVEMFRSVPHRTVGLCHEFMGVRKKLARLLGVESAQIQAKVAGINHLTWITGLQVAGQDAWPMLEDIVEGIRSGQVDMDADDISPFADHGKVKASLFQVYGALPAAGDRHVAEFFPNFLTEVNGWGEEFGVALTSIEFRQALVDYEKTMLESTLAGEMPLEPFMKEHSGEAASLIPTGLASDGRYIGIMNLPNVGQVGNIPYDAVVETFGIINHTGAHGLAFGDLPAGIQTVIERHVRNQEMTLEASLTGDRDLALQVLLNDPLSSRLSLEEAKAMLDELLQANRQYLKQFFGRESDSTAIRTR